MRDLNYESKRIPLSEDIKSYKADLFCLQETKITEDIDTNLNGSRIICNKSENHHYDTGFLISTKWANNIYKHGKFLIEFQSYKSKRKKARHVRSMSAK